MTSRTEALLDGLAKIHPRGFDLSLDRISALLVKLGNSHLNIPPAVHVAGTNGKGSTLAFCRAILEAAGYSVHVHTSPHLVNWNERYRLSGRLVDDDTLADAIERATAANGDAPITIFEIMSAVMLILFSEHEADFSLVEVGLGGRFDATNVIVNPLVCAITPVALDHQAYLGETISEIAFEKAGIIKKNVPVAVGLQEYQALEVIKRVAAKNRSPVKIARQDFLWYRDVTGFVYLDEDGLIDLPQPRLSGEHQLGNAALAIAALKAADIDLSDTAFQEGMRAVSWPGRLERLPQGVLTKAIGENADIWVDGGHNPSAGKAIANELLVTRKGHNRKLLLICGMINTKEPVGYFQPFAELQADVVSVPVAASEAGIDPETLADMAIAAGLKAQAADSLERGVQFAKAYLDVNPDAQILFCGSLYMVGEVLSVNQTPPT